MSVLGPEMDLRVPPLPRGIDCCARPQGPSPPHPRALPLLRLQQSPLRSFRSVITKTGPSSPPSLPSPFAPFPSIRFPSLSFIFRPELFGFPLSISSPAKMPFCLGPIGLANYFPLILLLLLAAAELIRSDVLEQWTKKGQALLADSKIAGVQIRQCTCKEQGECIDELQVQGLECVKECWPKFGAITNNPDALRKCFTRADVLIEEFIDCFETTVESCLQQREEKMIPKVNLTEMVRLGVERIERTKQLLGRSLAEGPIRKIIDTAGIFGTCVKDCFLAKNPDQFCFDKKDCQPQLLGTKATKSLRRCTKRIDWKKESGELCECSVKAGLHEMEQYCPMLKLMGDRPTTAGKGQRRPKGQGHP